MIWRIFTDMWDALVIKGLRNVWQKENNPKPKDILILSYPYISILILRYPHKDILTPTTPWELYMGTFKWNRFRRKSRRKKIKIQSLFPWTARPFSKGLYPEIISGTEEWEALKQARVRESWCTRFSEKDILWSLQRIFISERLRSRLRE